MRKIVPVNSTIRNLFYQELVVVISLILSDIFIFFLTQVHYFLLAQIFVIPTLAYYTFSKHKKQVLEIIIDEDSKKVSFKVNTLILWNKDYVVPFEEITVIHKYQWLFKFLHKVILIKCGNNKIITIAYKDSIWTDIELDNLVLLLKNYVSLQDLTATKNLKENRLNI